MMQLLEIKWKLHKSHVIWESKSCYECKCVDIQFLDSLENYVGFESKLLQQKQETFDSSL